jgi:hypothetical protein
MQALSTLTADCSARSRPCKAWPSATAFGGFGLDKASPARRFAVIGSMALRVEYPSRFHLNRRGAQKDRDKDAHYCVPTVERTAKANLIRRQEETAATRSLLNTAMLMEENPLLLRLKELESLERLVEKVGRIDLHAGEGPGLDALLSQLVRLKASEPA